WIFPGIRKSIEPRPGERGHEIGNINRTAARRSGERSEQGLDELLAASAAPVLCQPIDIRIGGDTQAQKKSGHSIKSLNEIFEILRLKHRLQCAQIGKTDVAAATISEPADFFDLGYRETAVLDFQVKSVLR